MTTTTTRPHTLQDEGVVDELFERLEHTETDTEREELRGEVVVHTIRVADALAHRYSGRGLEVQDLEQVARTALVVAVARYRPDVGRGFLAYAVPTITGELKRHFRDRGWSVRPPRRLQELRSEVAGVEDRLRQDLAREPTDAELAEAVGVRLRDVLEAKECDSGFRPTSLDAPTPTGTSLAATLADSHDDVDRWVTVAALRSLVEELPSRDRLVLVLRFEEERTQQEIGEAIGVSQMQVSRLLSRILGRLREGLEVPVDA